MSALIERVTLGDDLDAGVCLSELDAAGPALMTAIAAGGPGAGRLTTAMAYWRMARLDDHIPDVEARLFSASDRRLLRDAVQAARGRASPSPEHEAVFARFPWYKPLPMYTPSRLTPVDRDNMAVLDKPPPEPKPIKPAAEAMAEAEAEAPVAPRTESMCGCASTSPAGSLAGIGLALTLLARRRFSR